MYPLGQIKKKSPRSRVGDMGDGLLWILTTKKKKGSEAS